MACSFVAYIDESGDEGFTFREDGSGSSRWFVLSALIVRKSNDLLLVDAAKRARELLQYQPKKTIHFCKLKHEQRTPVARIVGELPVRTVSVLVHKPSIPNPGSFQQQPYNLYRYASRLLMERVSWCCRDAPARGGGDGKVDLIYSNRSAMSYTDLRAYLSRLQNLANTQIDWSVIDPNLVQAVNHDQMAGLQLADVVASGIYQSVNANRYGDVEERYLELMRRTVYKRNERHDGYGVKFWCTDQAVSQRILALIGRR